MQVSGTKNGKAPPFLYLISKIPLVVETFLAKLLENSKTSMCLFRLFTDVLKEEELH